MSARDILIVLLVALLVSHFFGFPVARGGPIGFALAALLVLALAVKL